MCFELQNSVSAIKNKTKECYTGYGITSLVSFLKLLKAVIGKQWSTSRSPCNATLFDELKAVDTCKMIGFRLIIVSSLLLHAHTRAHTHTHTGGHGKGQQRLGPLDCCLFA